MHRTTPNARTHTVCVVFMSHTESIYYFSRRVVCVFHFHMQSRVSLLLLTQSRVYSLLSHSESRIFHVHMQRRVSLLYIIVHTEPCVMV